MNKTPRLTVILALVGGLVLANTAIFKESFADTSLAETTPLGHFTLIVTDEFGNIKDYREIDNTITNEGDACIATLAFAATGAACNSVIESIAVSNCDGAGTSTGQGNNDCDTIDDTETTFDDTEDPNIGDECDTTAEAGYVAPAYTTGPNKVRITSEFTFSPLEVDADGLVKEAGILSGCAVGDQLFAIKDFATVTLTGSDKLTVNYDVTFSG